VEQESKSEEELKASSGASAEAEQAHPFSEAVTAAEEPQEARGAPGSRDEGLPPEDSGPANRPQ
jgi:hypothetical protein